MQFRAPKHVPPPSILFANLGACGHPARVAELLGVHERTVYGWMARDEMPRPAALALFWESTWGRQWNQANGANELSMLNQQVQALTGENQRLQGRVAYLERTGHFGCANAPTLIPAPFWPVQRLHVV